VGWRWFHISWIIDLVIVIAGIGLFFLVCCILLMRRVVDLLVIVIVLDIIADGFWVIVSIVLRLGWIVGIVGIWVCLRHEDRLNGRLGQMLVGLKWLQVAMESTKGH
jgi:hypothetical protein